MRTLVVLMCLIAQCFSGFAQNIDYLLYKFKGHKEPVRGIAFNKSGNLLATGGEDKALFILELDSYETKYEHKGNYFQIADIEFFGESQLFITSGPDIKLIDLENNSLALFKGNTTHLWSIDFAPERNKITAGSYDKNIKVWNVATQGIELVLEGHEKSTLPVVFSHNEKYIVSGSRDLTIKIWNAKTGELMKSLERHSGNIYDVTFHPNNKYFATASDDKTIRLWDMETGEVKKTYAGHDAAVLDIEFSPDGYFLYSASLDGSVIIWEVNSANKLYSYISHVGAVNAVEVDQSGYFTATGGDDGIVYIWESAKVIAVDTYYHDNYSNEKQKLEKLRSKQKGESKEQYNIRLKEIQQEHFQIIDKYFKMYMEENNYRNIP